MRLRDVTVWLLIGATPLTLRTATAQEADASHATTNARVFFATNRGRNLVEEPQAVRFEGQRGTPAYGTCEMEFKPIPLLDDVASKVPFYVPSETSEMRIELEENPEAFWERLSTDRAGTSSAGLVVFVHGYSYDFARSCRRAVEIQRDLAGEATVLLISWPSNGDATDYVPDLADLEWSVPFLADLLERLSVSFGPSNLHVLSHSLGARGVMLALERLRKDHANRPVVGRWVLLAPDIDSQIFVDSISRLEPMAESLTLYASSTDTPLKVSRRLNESPRLGEAGEFLTVLDGMETIDVSPAGRYQILGHEYFFFHPRVAADLALLLTSGKSAAERPGLRPRTLHDLTYWEVSEEDDS